MSQNFLKRYRSTLSTSQGNQLLKKLLAKKNNGEIRTINEFKSELKRLTEKLIKEKIAPTLEPFYANENEDVSSEKYNEMLEKIQDDLETAFTEADNIDAVISAHHNIINNVGIKTLRLAINDLESKINFYEFINKSNLGFDDAIFNTFRESQNPQTNRSQIDSSSVFLDPKDKEVIPVAQDAFVDFIGERLILGSSNSTYYSIKDAEWLSNSSSIRSELDVTFPNSSIRNIIDNKNNTYWVVPVLLTEKANNGVLMEVELKLNGSQNVNFIEIEPASDSPMTLYGIDYIDSNHTRQTYSSTEFTLNGPRKINLSKITAKSVILQIRQTNYKQIQFKQKPGESLFHAAVLGENKDFIDLESINDELRQVLSSSFILDSVIGVPTITKSEKKYYQYLLGFDNIRLGYSEYQDRGIFVSSKKIIKDPGQFAIKVDEYRPYQNAGESDILIENFKYPSRTSSSDVKLYHASMEYWLIAQLYTSDDFLINTVTLPLLPLNANRIYHERLVFTKKTSSSLSYNNKAQLMFYTEADSSDVYIYRNGTLLTYGNTSSADWEFIPASNGDTDVDGNTLATAADSTMTLDTPNAGARMKKGIRIWNEVNPLDIYTVSYTPKLSNTNVVPGGNSDLFDIVDLSGDQTIRLAKDNIIVMDRNKGSHIIDRAEIYLSIILRRNSANKFVTPSLEEFMLLSGKKNQSKFIGD